MWAQLSFVLIQITRLTDRQTDGQTEFSSLDRVCIPCSGVKTVTINLSVLQTGACWSRVALLTLALAVR